MAKIFHLECFDDAGFQVPRHHPEFSRGYDEGLLAGRTQLALDQKALSAEIVSAFSDAIFTYAEARQAVLLELEPILQAIPKCLVPALIEAGLATTLIDLVDNAASSAASSRPTVRLHPEMHEVLMQSTFGLDFGLFKLIADPNVPKTAAWIKAEKSDTSIDFEDVSAAISVALENYTHTVKRKEANVAIGQ